MISKQDVPNDRTPGKTDKAKRDLKGQVSNMTLPSAKHMTLFFSGQTERV